MDSYTLSDSDAAHTLGRLSSSLEAEVHADPLHRLLYAQDASVYQEEPLGVVFPKTVEDVESVVRLAQMLDLTLIPRAAGTSLAGQCVGSGLVVDTGRYMNQILELNVEERWVRVQPGVILDDLNRYLSTYGLFFGPDTSTSNRCMIGGMVGNNSCGSHSILYGTTRDHVLELEVVFSDGVVERIGSWTEECRLKFAQRQDVLGGALRSIDAILSEHKDLIRACYPRQEVRRRNTGYALDELLQMTPHGEKDFELTKLLCGSEGTLCLTTEVTLRVVELPKHKNIVVAHFDSIDEALRATLVAVAHDPAAVELSDKRILDLSKQNIEQARHRFFLEGDPGAILVIEFYRDSEEELALANEAVVQDLKSRGLGYSYPVFAGAQSKAVWELRKAGLGILMGVPGDVKPVTVVEDTAVAVDVLPDYIREFSEVMARHETQCVYYAHASVGELHLRPELNLKESVDAQKFTSIAREVTDLVKKYGGSISGEHGDGRLRSPMLAQFYGETLTQAQKKIKAAFDPRFMMNPGKIIDPKPMDEDWRFVPGAATPKMDTFFDWSDDRGFVRAVEKCNGAGVCRKRAESGGTMCPSYMATLDEKDSTRGRANIFRHMLLKNENPCDAMTDPIIHEALKLCLSCKGCKSECPASVDMGKMKAEFLQHYHDRHGTPFSSRLFAEYGRLSRLASIWPWFANFVMTFALTRWLMNKVLKISPKRQFPSYAPQTFRKLFVEHRREGVRHEHGPLVWVYSDPFTEYTEPDLAMSTVRVLEACGMRVEILPIRDDGRTYLSKGLVRHTQRLLSSVMDTLDPLLKAHPYAKVVGVEPSALLTFRDEALSLMKGERKQVADALAKRCMLLDEFVVFRSNEDGFVSPWTHAHHEPRIPLLLHGHCHQKALVGVHKTTQALQLAGYEVDVLQTGCCGMAGSFGYEESHYELSMSIGELALFPALRNAPKGVGVAALGTSCRHQILDGTRIHAHHPAVWLERALVCADA